MKRAEKSYVIFGIGKFGRSVAEELTAAGMHVLAIDKDEDKVTAVADTVTMAVTGDVTDPKDMDGLGLSNFDAAIVATTGDLSAGGSSSSGILEPGCSRAGRNNHWIRGGCVRSGSGAGTGG